MPFFLSVQILNVFFRSVSQINDKFVFCEGENFCFNPTLTQVPANPDQIEMAAATEIIETEIVADFVATSQGTLRRSSSTLSRNSLLSSRRNSSAISSTPLSSCQQHGGRRRNSSVFEQASLGSSFDEPAASSSTSLCRKRSFKLELIAKMRSASRGDRPRITITRAPTLDQSGKELFAIFTCILTH